MFYFVVNVKAVSGLTIELATYISEWLKATSYLVYWIVGFRMLFSLSCVKGQPPVGLESFSGLAGVGKMESYCVLSTACIKRANFA